jgi:hypothetical protein
MIKDIKNRVSEGNYRFTIHGLERCIERNISPNDIEHAILSGEIIEDYPEDKYGPSILILGRTEKGEILHIQCSVEPMWIIAAYNPTLRPNEWDNDFRRKIKKS